MAVVLKTSMPPEACIKRLRRVTDTVEGNGIDYSRDIVMKIHKSGFNLWRAFGSAMPSKLDLCSPVFKARLTEDGRGGTVISGGFGMRPLGMFLLSPVVLLLGILVTLAIATHSTFAGFMRDMELGGWKGLYVIAAVAGAIVWAWFGWRTDKASLIEFLEEYLKAELVGEKQIPRSSE